MNRISPALSFSVLGLAFWIGFTGCTKPDSGTGADGGDAGEGKPAALNAPIEKEILDLKSRNLAPQQEDAALRDLLLRHGKKVPEQPAPAALPGPITVETESGDARPDAPLAKTAGFISYWNVEKSYDFTYRWVNQRILTIAAGATVVAWTERTEANSGVDPMLVAYYANSGEDLGRNTVNVVALADDQVVGLSLDPIFSWTNNTGASVVLHIMAFSYSYATVGEVTLALRVKYVHRYAGYISAYREFDNNGRPPRIAGCSGPTASRVTMNRDQAWNGQGVLAVNGSTMRGGDISGSTGSVQLQDFLASGYPNWILPYFDGFDGYPGSEGAYPPIPSINAGQQDKYSCPVKPFP